MVLFWQPFWESEGRKVAFSNLFQLFNDMRLKSAKKLPFPRPRGNFCKNCQTHISRVCERFRHETKDLTVRDMPWAILGSIGLRAVLP